MNYHPKSPVRECELRHDEDVRLHIVENDKKYGVVIKLVEYKGKQVFWAVKGAELEPVLAIRTAKIHDDLSMIVRRHPMITAIAKIIEHSVDVSSFDLRKLFPRNYLQWVILSDTQQILTTKSAVEIYQLLRKI